ncbi:MAG: hypothetical protein GX620_17540 [Chloroflexi bacterium]|nr:hypothetical protein [Chloroflexota bacterium]
METIRQFLEQRKTFVALVGGAVLGLIVGLVIGWVLWPVEYANLTPAQLRSDFQDDYILWVAENYEFNGGAGWAQQKLGTDFWRPGQLDETLERLALEQGGVTATRLRALKTIDEDAASAGDASESEAASAGETTESRSLLRPLLMVCGVTLLVLALAGGVLIVVTRLREAKQQIGDSEGIPDIFAASESGVGWGEEAPQAQFVTTYTLGDDHYDPSFSIELANGEFMGECGVGISETVGVGEPNKVTAFELWLFDKNDIRTVTKVLMSGYAFNDEALRTKLAPKGEPVQADVGQDVILETKRLRVRARLIEVDYGTGNLPPNSFFERMTVDLAAWVKPGDGDDFDELDEDVPFMPAAL